MSTSHDTPACGHDDGGATRLITTSELASRLGVTSDTIRKWTREGRIPCLRVGQKTLRFDADAVMAALSANDRSATEGGDA